MGYRTYLWPYVLYGHIYDSSSDNLTPPTIRQVIA